MIEANEFVAGAACLDFVNTVGGHREAAFDDKLESYGDLLDWNVLGGFLSKARAKRLRMLALDHQEAAARTLRRAKDFREAMYAVFHAATMGRPALKRDLDLLNAEIGAALSHARIKREGDRYDWDWSEADVLDAPLWSPARSAAELLTSDRLDRLCECASDTCGWLFLDLSKNRSRRWCDMKSCGNRAKVRRYRQRGT